MLSNCACWIALLKVSEVNKVIAYSHIPSTLLSIYNAFFGKEAKELCPDTGRYGYAVFLTVMVAAILS